MHVIHITKHDEKYFISLWAYFPNCITNLIIIIIIYLFNFGRFQRTRFTEIPTLNYFIFKQRVAKDFPLIYRLRIFMQICAFCDIMRKTGSR